MSDALWTIDTVLPLWEASNRFLEAAQAARDTSLTLGKLMCQAALHQGANVEDLSHITGLTPGTVRTLMHTASPNGLPDATYRHTDMSRPAGAARPVGVDGPVELPPPGAPSWFTPEMAAAIGAAQNGFASNAEMASSSTGPATLQTAAPSVPADVQLAL